MQCRRACRVRRSNIVGIVVVCVLLSIVFLTTMYRHIYAVIYRHIYVVVPQHVSFTTGAAVTVDDVQNETSRLFGNLLLSDWLSIFPCFLADCTSHSAIGPSVCLSVTLCIVAVRISAW